MEDYFETIGFCLTNYDEADQKCFLYKYWRSLTKKQQQRATSARLHTSAEELLAKLKSIHTTNITQLIGIPLQTKMIADIYFENAINNKTSKDDDDDAQEIRVNNLAVVSQVYREANRR